VHVERAYGKDTTVVRIGLVLGAGGAVGHAFHAGVLAGITEATGWDARDAEVIVGTSAGSVVGALLRAGTPTVDLAARSMGAALSDEGRRIVARAESARYDLPHIPARRPARSWRGASAPSALVRAALQPWNARPAALVAAALPEGDVPTELVSSGLRPLFTEWPHRTLWIVAVDLVRGRRVTFGREGAPAVADVATAVAASCAIPAFFAPVSIDGIRYVDGGVHSATNADLLADLELDLVVVSSPMSIARTNPRFAADQPARRLARYQLAREATRIRGAGTPVLTFQPTGEDLSVMGLNAMDSSRGAEVTRQALDSTRRRLARADAQDRVAILTSTTPRA
jgi:NTE family protein